MRRALVWTAVLLIGVLGGACDTRHAWEGRYAGRPDQGPAGAVVLTLEGGGKGQWTAEGESTPLRWEERSGSLWLHLKSGGVLAARPVPGQPAVTLDLPGVGTLTLRKAAH